MEKVWGESSHTCRLLGVGYEGMPQDRGRALRQRDVPKLVHVPACGVPGITSNPERSALEALEATV